MTKTGAAARPAMDLDERAESVFAWIQLHTRAIAIGAAVVVAAALGGWLYMRSEATQEQRAAERVAQAQRSMEAGNAALAQSDLERVVRNFSGTRAGRQAALLLSEVLYGAGKYQEGIDHLETVARLPRTNPMAAVAEAQVAAGYEELGKFAEAAERYKRAAEKARFAADRALYLAGAARAYATAGNAAAARQIWAELAEDETSPVAGEARIRLGELTAQPARRS